ncbi:hypothetical protein, conserved [Babesia bigemina]|uniref:Uncharacterized protein n=1 Tax=Babesia bigemina TaxID=5866 RepID=A0A061BK06_BABBI|nr:hypothetical protein, conserved [Babesia bigemina]CDR71820.1 hypothetical protein, conserved [Babesia bigemina]|eukprot:XP_012770763.1 hypothetical protein, conserved [Babesia bigemina]
MTSINHYNNLCPVTLHFPASTSCHCPDHVPPRELGEKFHENKKCEITSNNNPTNILNNLCSGLETFLGFNSANKGYNGTGIVYSDLDRLCDGVMGFLSGVLSNIYKHLGQHKNTLNDAITSLNTNKHLGKKGFNAAIVKVVAGVRGYNDKVKRSNDDIKRPIETLLTHVNEEVMKKVSAILNDNAASGQNTYSDKDIEKVKRAVTEATNLVKTCIDSSNAYLFGIDSQRKNINDLNHELKLNVHNVTKHVKHESGRLHDLAWKAKGDLEAMDKVINDKLKTVKENVNCRIKIEVNELVENLKLKVSAILIQLKQISENLADSLSNLELWMEKTKHMIDNAVAKLDLIINKTVGRENREFITSMTEQIGRDVKQLHSAGQDAKNRVAALVRDAHLKVRELQTALQFDLGTIKDEIRSKVSKVVSAIVSLGRQFYDGSIKTPTILRRL